MTMPNRALPGDGFGSGLGSLIVWLTFLIYLHARYVRRWSGNQAAVAAILGFLFAMLSFVGHSVLGGLHAYG